MAVAAAAAAVEDLVHLAHHVGRARDLRPVDAAQHLVVVALQIGQGLGCSNKHKQTGGMRRRKVEKAPTFQAPLSTH
jgi:hypothetical protein